MRLTFSTVEQVVTRARKKAEALGKSLNQLIRDYLQTVAGGDDPERSIEEFTRLSGRGQGFGGEGGYPRITVRRVEVEGWGEYGSGKCSTMSAFEGEWDTVWVSGAAAQAALLFS